MEDTEVASAGFARSDDTITSTVSFGSRTLELVEVIDQLDTKWQNLGINQHDLKWRDLVPMLKGAWAALEPKDNPDRVAHAAHSMRELFEKACYLIGQVPDHTQDMDDLEEDDKRTPARLLVDFFIGNEGSTSEQILDFQADAIWKLRKDFVEISHHSSEHKTIGIEEMKLKIGEMENVLLDLFSPQPIEDLDELDALMAQGESV